MKHISDWEVDFHDRFSFDGVTYMGQRHTDEGVKMNLVKSFIHSLLKAKGEEAVKEIESKKYRTQNTMADGIGYTLKFSFEKQLYNEGLTTAAEIISNILK